MIQIILLIKRFELPFLCLIGIDGIICCCIADYLKKRNEKTPGSVAHCRQWTLGLYIAGFLCMVGAMLALFVLGYYDQWLRLLFQS